MTLLKHILVAVALLAAAFPCCHAAGHGVAAGNGDAEVGVDASHSCHCHSCDESAIHDHVEIPQELTVSSDVMDLPVTSLQLFVFSETKPLKRFIPPAARGILSSIQTVQLLI